MLASAWILEESSPAEMLSEHMRNVFVVTEAMLRFIHA